MTEDDGFLGRWSRRKASVREKAAPAEGPQHLTPDNHGQERAGGQAVRSDAPAEPDSAPGERDLELPDIDSLGRDSDFAVFMQRGVPDALRKQALRKLWRLDPAFSKLDGLVEYGEDYNAPARRPGLVRTAWRIGRGMTGPEAADEGQGGEAEPNQPARERERERPGETAAGGSRTLSKDAGSGDGEGGDSAPS